nr:alpha/beta hydrolase [Pseudomonas sp.]
MRFEPTAPLQSMTVNGYAMSYLEMGAGDPVLLVHGSLCDCRYWAPQMAALSVNHRVIAVSLRHYWPATATADDGSFSVSQHAADLLGLLDVLALPQAHVIGHSRGGRVALELALRHRGRVRSLVLADPGAQFTDEPQRASPAFVAEATHRLRSGDIEGGLGLFVDAVNGDNTWARMIAGFKRMARDNADTLLGQSIEPIQALSESELHALIVPALLVGGAASPRRYAHILDRLAAHLPRAMRVTIEGAAHGMNLAKPHSFNTAVLDFLAQHRAGDNVGC